MYKVFVRTKYVEKCRGEFLTKEYAIAYAKDLRKNVKVETYVTDEKGEFYKVFPIFLD